MTPTPRKQDDLLPPEPVAELSTIEDWRVRGLRLSALFAQHEADTWGWRAAALRQVARATGQHSTSVNNLLSITRWLRDNFPQGLEMGGPTYAFRSAIALRTVWRRDPATAALIANRVFDGTFGPTSMQDAVGLAESMERLREAEDIARLDSGHARLATDLLRKAVRVAVRDWVAPGGKASIHDPADAGLPPGPYDFVVRPPDGPLILVRAALLPTPTSDNASYYLAADAALMASFGQIVVVISEARRDLADRVGKSLLDWRVANIVILLARPKGQDAMKVRALTT